MNWKLLLPPAVLGPLMGLLTVVGAFPKGTDRFAWFMVVLVSAFLVARRERRRALLHGAALGFWNGASSTLLQALMMDRWVANNPWVVDIFAEQPPGFDLEFFLFMLVPFIGVAGGAMTGLLSMALARVLGGREGRGGSGETAP
jgi:hypothetical protein